MEFTTFPTKYILNFVYTQKNNCRNNVYVTEMHHACIKLHVFCVLDLFFSLYFTETDPTRDNKLVSFMIHSLSTQLLRVYSCRSLFNTEKRNEISQKKISLHSNSSFISRDCFSVVYFICICLATNHIQIEQ